MLPVTPTPPPTINAPVDVLVEAVELVTLRTPPVLKSPVTRPAAELTLPVVWKLAAVELPVVK